MHDAYARCLWPCEREAFRPAERIAVSRWCNGHIVLPDNVTPESGPYRWQRTPYVGPILDLYTRPSLRHLVLKWATQTSKTQVIHNLIGYIIDQDPYNTLVVYPTEGQCRDVSRTRIQPIIDASPDLRDNKPEDDSFYQLMEMHFTGMILFVTPGSTEVGTSQKSVRNLIRDEINKLPPRLVGGGDPMKRTKERVKAYKAISKVIDVSSPTDENGNITREEKKCQVILGYFVPCPHCGRLQLLEWDETEGDETVHRLRFDDGKDLDAGARIALARRSAWYECRYCRDRIEDRHKPWMLAPENGAGWFPVDGGEPQPSTDPIEDLFAAYAARGEVLESVGTRLSSIYSPFLTFGDVAAAFLEAHLEEGPDRMDALREFTTDWLDREWRETVSEKRESAAILELRGELPPMVCPRETVALTCGVDCQKRGFYFSTWAWARDWRRWMIHYGYLMSWDDVTRLIYESSYQVADTSHRINIFRAGVDTGGGKSAVEADASMTEAAYRWLARYGGQTAFGLKGSSRRMSGKLKFSTIGQFPRSREPIPGAGLRLCLVDTDYFKDLTSAALQIPQGDTGCVYLHRDTGEDFAEHMVAEEKQRSRGVTKWVHVRGRNDWWDTTNYAAVVADPMFLGGINVLPDPDWDSAPLNNDDIDEQPHAARRRESRGWW